MASSSVAQRMKNRLARQASLGLKGAPLTSLNRRWKKVVVEAIIGPELKLCNVKMQVFLSDIVECTDDAALDDAPEAFNRIGVNCANYVLVPRVVNEVGIPCHTEGGPSPNLPRKGFV